MQGGLLGHVRQRTQTCDMSLAVSLYQNVNLVMEKPELKTINSEPVINVTIDSVTYDVAMNTLNVDDAADDDLRRARRP